MQPRKTIASSQVPDCVDRIHKLVSEFVDAMNEADRTAIMDSLASARSFEWYSRRVPDVVTIYESADATDFLLARAIDFRERTTVSSLTVRPDGNFEYVLHRVASDIDEEGVNLVGKGAASCDSNRIMVWSEGGAP